MNISYGELAVFPCHSVAFGMCSCGRRNCRSPGKHPRTNHGCSESSNSPTVHGAWLSRWPDANWAIATGAVSGVAVIDVDPAHGGDGSLNKLVREYDISLNTWAVETGGGGFHYYFSIPDSLTIRCRNGFRPGIDIKGEGGYVMRPGCRHISGRIYRWMRGQSPAECPIAEFPMQLFSGLHAVSEPLACEPQACYLGASVSLSR